MSKLSPEQTAQVEKWAADGATLNQIQERLRAECGITLTYLDARLLMLDIGVNLKDKPREVAKPAETPAAEPEPQGKQWVDEDLEPEEGAAPPPAPAGGLKISVDEITLPNALISGKVAFSDGTKASWYIDQMGRLGLGGTPPGYQPPAADIPVFQRELDRMLQQQGF